MILLLFAPNFFICFQSCVFKSGKLRQFKYGKKKKQAAEKAAENGTTLKPHAPATKGADVNSEKENILASRSKTPPPKPKKETHEMSISTSPIPIEEEDLVSNPIPPREEQVSRKKKKQERGNSFIWPLQFPTRVDRIRRTSSILSLFY